MSLLYLRKEQTQEIIALYFSLHWFVKLLNMIVLVGQIMKHLELNEILADARYGFRSNHSYEAQLFLTIDDFTRVVENKLQTDTV